MGLPSYTLAERASFNAFLNCYLREIDGGVWRVDECLEGVEKKQRDTPWLIEIQLTELHLCLRVKVAYKSLIGRHLFDCVDIRSSYESDWRSSDKLHAQIAIIQNIYLKKRSQLSDSKSSLVHLKEKEAELLARVLESHQLMARYIEFGKRDRRLADFDFISTEQSCLLGHWLHPTPKSRQGMTFWQQAHYSPEMRGRFKLHYFSVHEDLVVQGSVLEQSTSDLLFDSVKPYLSHELEEKHVIIPQHPLQAQNLLLDKQVQSLIQQGLICDLGPLGEEYTPTSSVRTLYSESSPWMLKFSIPVKITNSLRKNRKCELQDGMEVEKFLQSVGFMASRPCFKIVDDPAYIAVSFPGKPDQDSGFEVVVRRNLVYKEPENNICSILTLVQDPLHRDDGSPPVSLLKQLLDDIAKKENRQVSLVAKDWFSRYFECAIGSLLRLYDRHGVALEAHLQNSLLDVSAGYPSTYYYRDNQGFYLSKSYQKQLQTVGDKLTFSDIFYDDKKIFEAIAYYVFFNQLFAVVNRMGVDGLVKEEILIELVQSNLLALKKEMKGVGRELIDYMLQQKYIACKTNLLARVNDIDELHEGVEGAVYANVLNPLVSSVDQDEVQIKTTKPNNKLKAVCHAI